MSMNFVYGMNDIDKWNEWDLVISELWNIFIR
jgi:hypothetical protein